MLDSISQGEEREDGSPTLQGLEKFIRDLDPDSNMLDAFKEADPTTYLDTFGLPQTNAGLDFFANLGLTGDKKTDAKIIEARERLAQSKESQDRASGIMTASSAPSVPPVVPPTTPDVPPVVPPVVPPTTSAFDLAKFYASLPQYTQQGVMSTSLMQYYRNLGLFPRA